MVLPTTVLSALVLLPAASGHATGSKNECNPTATKKCTPPTPCWGDKPGTMIQKKYFGKRQDLVMPDGTPWIATGDGPIPMWCPGDVMPIRTYLNADHNGVYRWESQLASPGKETESAFVNFTSWKSVNQDPDADFYASDGITKLTPGKCYKPGKCETWSPTCPHCRNDAFSNTSLTIPINMPAGETVLRWFWYGAMTTDGVRVHGPEHSLFVNCKDVVIGTPEQCRHSTRPKNDILV